MTVRAIEPEARIILYGSRARGRGKTDSDWDFLILLPGEVNNERQDRILNELYDVELECDEILSAAIYSESVWQSPRYHALPFHENVEREGIVL